GLLVIAVTAAIGFRPPDSPVRFRQITFRRGQVSGARFGEGPRNILYAAQWEDGPRRIYEAHMGDPVSRILGFEGLSLVAGFPFGRVGGHALGRHDEHCRWHALTGHGKWRTDTADRRKYLQRRLVVRWQTSRVGTRRGWGPTTRISRGTSPVQHIGMAQQSPGSARRRLRRIY